MNSLVESELKNTIPRKTLVCLYFVLIFLASPLRQFLGLDAFSVQESVLFFCIGICSLWVFLFIHECSVQQYVRNISPWVGIIALLNCNFIYQSHEHDFTANLFLTCFWGSLEIISTYLFFYFYDGTAYNTRRPKHVDCLFYNCFVGMTIILIKGV